MIFKYAPWHHAMRLAVQDSGKDGYRVSKNAVRSMMAAIQDIAMGVAQDARELATFTNRRTVEERDVKRAIQKQCITAFK